MNLAAPVMLGMLGHTFVSLVDNVMVGQLGATELAAVSLGNSFVFVAMALGIVLFSLLLLAKPLMRIMNQPEDVVALAIPYLDLVAFSLIPLIVFQAFKQFSDGLSLTKYPMYATILANVINVVLNYLLIFGKFGFPELGIVGAAIGTLISRVVMVFFLWWVLRAKEKSKAFVTDIKIFVLESEMLKKIMDIGLPSAMQMFFEVAIFTSAVWLSGTLGQNPQAANQIALNLASMTFMVATGLSVAATIRVGNQKGLKNFIELRRIAISIFLLGVIIAVVSAVAFLLLHKILPTIYVDLDDPINAIDTREVVSIASTLLLLAAVFQISDSLQVVALGALRGLQDVRIPTVLTFISYWAIGFPISFYFGKEEALGSAGIWLGLIAGLTSASILLFIRFNYLTKKLIKLDVPKLA